MADNTPSPVKGRQKEEDPPDNQRNESVNQQVHLSEAITNSVFGNGAISHQQSATPSLMPQEYDPNNYQSSDTEMTNNDQQDDDHRRKRKSDEPENSLDENAPKISSNFILLFNERFVYDHFSLI